MGFLDDAKDKLGDAVDAAGDKIGDGVDKAGDLIKAKTGDEHDDKIDAAVDKAKDVLDGLDGRTTTSRTPSSSTGLMGLRPDSTSAAFDRRPERGVRNDADRIATLLA